MAFRNSMFSKFFTNRHKRNIAILIIVSLLLLFLGVREIYCALEFDCFDCEEVSKSKEQSIIDQYYISDYRPVTNQFRLKYHDETVRFDTIWAEHSWSIQQEGCKQINKLEQGRYSIVFPFKESDSGSFLFDFIPLIANEAPNFYNTLHYGLSETDINPQLHFQVRMIDLPDTIKLKIVEKNSVDSIGWERELEGDTLI